MYVPAYMTFKISVQGEFKEPFDAIHSKMTLTEPHFQGPNILWRQLVSASQVFAKHWTIDVAHIARPLSMGTIRPVVFRLT